MYYRRGFDFNYDFFFKIPITPCGLGQIQLGNNGLPDDLVRQRQGEIEQGTPCCDDAWHVTVLIAA